MGPAALLTAQKPIKRQVWWKGKFALFWRPATGGWTPDNQWARAFIDRGRGLHAETAQSALTVILKLVIGGLTTIILIVLSTASLQFQGQFVPISLRPFLRIVAAYIMATVWSSCINFFHLVGVSVSIRQLTGYGSAYYL